MMKSFRTLIACAAALLVLAGCAEPVVFSEIFQLRKEDKLYTKYNIWYEDPARISCLNIQRGSFLPLGTEIIPVSADAGSGKINFQDRKGRQYCIEFDSGYRLCTMSDFIAYTFTKEDLSQQQKGIPKSIRSRIQRGEVVPGMSQKHVLLTYGPPPAIRTPDLKNETWFYYTSPSQTIRVIFRGDKVRSLLKIDNLTK